MTELPNGWSPTTVKELAGTSGLFVDGDWVESKDQDPAGNIRLLQLADIGDGRFLDKSDRWINEDAFERLRCTELAAGDVLIARMPDPLGRACLMPTLEERCVTVVDVAALRVDPQVANDRWVMHAINAPQLRAEMNVQASGTTRKRISRGNLGNLQVPLPPRAEQQRIADKLDTVLARVDGVNERLARVAPLLKRFRQSVLAAATSGRLTEYCRATTTDQEHEHAALPASWLRLTLKNLGRVSTGSTPPKARVDFYGGEVPFVKPGDLDKGVIRKADETLTAAGSAEARMVRPGAIFVSCIGNLGKVGVAGLPMAFNQQINAIEFDSSVVSDRYGYLACMTLGPWLLENSSATTIAIINKGKFEQAEINVPPLNEQAEIVRRVETLFAFADRLEARLQAAQTAVDRLTPSLLAKAFRGELVPQDPSDEPASELLKRLASSTTTVSKRGRRSKTAQ